MMLSVAHRSARSFNVASYAQRYMLHVRVLLAFQQPTFQQHNTSAIVQLHMLLVSMLASSDHLKGRLLKSKFDRPMNVAATTSS